MPAQTYSGASASTSGAHAHGWAHTQGVRPTMEDEIIFGEQLSDKLHLWGVLDGHGGRDSVERVVKWLPEMMREAFSAPGAHDAIEATIAEAVEAVDARLLAEAAAEGFEDGTTALLVVSEGGAWAKRVYVSQTGDSQVVLCGPFGADALAPQHRPDDAEEEARLQAAGASVQDDRVVGRTRSLAVSRSLGDPDAKGCGVVATPHVATCELSAADELLILGCDGLWDVVEPEDAWSLVKRKAKGRDGKWDLAKAAKALVDEAMAKKTGDNVSVLVLALRPPKGEPPSAAPEAEEAALEEARSTSVRDEEVPAQHHVDAWRQAADKLEGALGPAVSTALDQPTHNPLAVLIRELLTAQLEEMEAAPNGGTAIESPEAIRETLDLAKEMAAKVEAIAARAGARQGQPQLDVASAADGGSLNRQRSTKAVMFRQKSTKAAAAVN